MTTLEKKFICKLLEKGVETSMIPGFIRSLANAVLVNPAMPFIQVKERLHYLGWDEIELDYHTYQLALCSFETKGLHTLEYKPSVFYMNEFIDKGFS